VKRVFDNIRVGSRNMNLVDTAQIEHLDKRKRQLVSAIFLPTALLLLFSAVRFVPRLNDALSGKPEYVRILTEAFARQFATQTQMQFPVIVEHDIRRANKNFSSAIRK
jgi:hypothetical protein